MKTQSIRSVFGLIAATAAAVAAMTGSAVAGPQGGGLLEVRVASEVVPYTDLDLNSGAGAQRMARRVEQAADRVCGGSLLRQGSPRLAQCRRQAIGGAMASLDAPLVRQALNVSPVRTTLARR